MRIKTEHVFPPIPDRSSDWSAVNEDTYSGEPSDIIGRGATERDAIIDLLEQLDDCTCQMETVHSASLTPPERKTNPDCPLHGWRDPDREREESRDER